jgi:hypothetical protein
LHTLNLSNLPHGNHFATHRTHSVSTWLEAGYDPSRTNRTHPELWVIERNSGRLSIRSQIESREVLMRRSLVDRILGRICHTSLNTHLLVELSVIICQVKNAGCQR